MAKVAQVVELGVVIGSLTITLVNATEPLFVAAVAKVSTSPTVTWPLPSPSALPVSDLVAVTLGVSATTRVVGVLLAVGPGTSVDLTEPVLLMLPAVTSAGVTV